MPRQRLTIGTFGEITTRKLPSGRFAARTRYRDWDGHARLVQASGATAKAAERALKAKIADRDLFQPADTSLTPDSLFSDLVTYWLEDIDLEARISNFMSTPATQQQATMRRCVCVCAYLSAGASCNG